MVRHRTSGTDAIIVCTYIRNKEERVKMVVTTSRKIGLHINGFICCSILAPDMTRGIRQQLEHESLFLSLSDDIDA